MTNAQGQLTTRNIKARYSQVGKAVSNGYSQEHNDRGIDTGKPGDESFALRLVLAGILHQSDNLRNGTLAK